jgi:amino acid transporter
MNQKPPQLAIWLMWLALPINVANYWRVWDRLPMRMAVHFNANWQPDGWASRDNFWVPAIGVIVFLLVVFTIAAYAVRAAGKPALTAWILLGFFYLSIGFVSYLGNRVIEYNLNQPVQHASVMRPERSFLNRRDEQ